MKRSQVIVGLGGAVIGIGVGLWGAVRPDSRDAGPLTPD